MKYGYFVSYSANKNNFSISTMCEAIFDKRITTLEQLASLCKTLEEDNGYKNVVINNYKFLRFKFF